MSNISINDCVYRIHPVYNLYAANENGELIHISRKIPTKGVKNHTGYTMCSVRESGRMQKNYFIHRFVWECF